MKKLNTIIVGKNTDSINLALKDFVDFMGFNIFANINEVFRKEKTNNFDIVIWDMDVEDAFCEAEYKKLNSDLEGKKLIFISSNPELALNAFNFGAVDFLLKPICSDRLFTALEKAIYLIDAKGAMLDTNKSVLREDPVKFVAVSSLKDVKIIPVNSIAYLESEGRYTLINKLDGEVVVSSKNLGFYDDLLANNNFYRIHHSFLVNVDLSLNIEKRDGVYLQTVNNKQLPISKRRIVGFYRFLGIAV